MHNHQTISIGLKDKDYPKLLKEIGNPPDNIFVRGNIESINAPSVAIVGTRKATQAGIKTATEIAYNLGLNGLAIVSGLAMGIDSAAHEGALKAGAKTVAVLGGSVDKIYPAQNEILAKRILETGGAIVSEYGHGMPTYKSNFLQRNRITSGLAMAVVVVEMPIKSGAINTANWAAGQGRSVFVVPGPANHPNYAGSHKLIRDGGTLATCAEDILEDLGLSARKEEARRKIIFRNDAERIIFEAIETHGEPITADEIAEMIGLDIGTVNINLANLVIYKSISETAEGYTVA